jgi:hypothetical protein
MGVSVGMIKPVSNSGILQVPAEGFKTLHLAPLSLISEKLMQKSHSIV